MINKTDIKNTLKNILPKKSFELIRTNYIKYFSKYFNEFNLKTIEKYRQQIISDTGYIVIDGPFEGLKYVESAVGSSFLLKLAGYYEAVLNPYIEEAKRMNIKNILDIGCAEGYYAAGFARVFPLATISAFDMDTEGRRLTRKMFEINNLNTDNLQILEEASKENIVDHIKENTLFICDCEGAEKEILNIENKDLFKNIAFGIIELHDEFVPGCKEACYDYFKNTHSIEIVKFKHANPTEFKFLKNINSKRELNALTMERGIQDQEWMILRLNV